MIHDTIASSIGREFGNRWLILKCTSTGQLLTLVLISLAHVKFPLRQLTASSITSQPKPLNLRPCSNPGRKNKRGIKVYRVRRLLHLHLAAVRWDPPRDQLTVAKQLFSSVWQWVLVIHTEQHCNSLWMKVSCEQQNLFQHEEGGFSGLLPQDSFTTISSITSTEVVVSTHICLSVCPSAEVRKNYQADFYETWCSAKSAVEDPEIFREFKYLFLLHLQCHPTSLCE